MKRLIALTVALLLFTAPAFAAALKTYQVTGPVLEVSDDMIAVQKGKDRWEIARAPDTKVTGDLKVGAKVTIEYKMTATKVDVKEAAKAKEPAKKK
jgi:cytochrome c1